jgi:hypothetical protein
VHHEAFKKHIAARNQHTDDAEEHLTAGIIHLTLFMQHEALYHEHIGARNQHRAAVSELEYSQPLIKFDPVACHAKGWWSFLRNDVEAARHYFQTAQEHHQRQKAVRVHRAAAQMHHAAAAQELEAFRNHEKANSKEIEVGMQHIMASLQQDKAVWERYNAMDYHLNSWDELRCFEFVDDVIT